MIDEPLPLPHGGFVVPGNRWDLVRDRSAPMPDITVVVPWYRNREQLDLVLEGLAQQDYPRTRFEVVIADDGSPQPLTGDLRPEADLRIRVVRQDDRGFRAAAARNLAVRHSEGSVLVFLDQDTVPSPGYLRALGRWPALLPDALAVGRREHVDLEGWTPQRLRDGWDPPARFPSPAWLTDAYRGSGNLLRADRLSYRYVISAVMCCGRDLFRETGGFDESFTEYGGEDWEFAHRAWNAGAVLVHEPEAVAWHDGPDWAGRESEAGRRAAKSAENEALARRIPAPGRPAQDATEGGPADVVVLGPGASPDLVAGCHVLLDGPWPEPLDPIVARLRQQGVGEIAGPGLRVVSTRALTRTRRWEKYFPGRDLMADLFGSLPPGS
ncbi:hypothetical protein GCM10022223_06940 [Kineosporia mesophila]|uniref:GT2 family glycosyltransferase n=1 Tax=Kineosporia mesophila TaxID=566012 RepID=A0ABP6YYU8_9ACTN|nr:glycosyltransferase [Kineosporia mesophila]